MLPTHLLARVLPPPSLTLLENLLIQRACIHHGAWAFIAAQYH